MSALPNWLNSDLFSGLRDKYNAFVGFFNGLAGGSTDQILAKSSNSDFAFKWISSGASIPDPAGHDGESLQSNGTVLVYGSPKLITDGTYTMAFVIITFGDWNMDSTSTKNVSHGIDFTKILGVDYTIINDAGDKIYMSPDKASGTGDSLGISFVDSTKITFYRVDGGIFDSNAFDSTGYNRGLVTIRYLV